MKVLAIVQARMSSSRLPGKVLRDICGRSTISRVFGQLQNATRLWRVILATSNDPSDDPLADWAHHHGVLCYRGSLGDVLDRFYYAAISQRTGDSDYSVARITADCPLVSYEVLDDLIELFEVNQLDYCSNSEPRTFPDGWDVEVMTFEALEKAWREASTAYDREHVTPYIRRDKLRFKQLGLQNDVDHSQFRITLDTEDDLVDIQSIVESLGNPLVVNKHEILEALWGDRCV